MIVPVPAGADTKLSKPGSQSSSRQKTINGIPIAVMSPSSINNMVTNERFVFFRHDDNTNLSVANQSIIEDNESAADDIMETGSRAGAFGS